MGDHLPARVVVQSNYIAGGAFLRAGMQTATFVGMNDTM